MPNLVVITNTRVFDGDSVLDGPHDVLLADGLVSDVRTTGTPPPGHDIVDGTGGTVLPGLIDSHVHADLSDLRQAAVFGVTTVLDMGSSPDLMNPMRRQCAERPDLADVRSAVTGLTHPCGHPHQLIGDLGHPSIPTVSAVEEIGPFVDGRVAEGADYLKTWIENGEVLGHPVTALDPELLNAFVAEGHRRGLRVLVHALTRAATEQVVTSGADGLTHLFVDEGHTDALVEDIRRSGMHVVPTLTLLASLCGDPSGRILADDPRVQPFLRPSLLENLRHTWSTLSPGHLRTAMGSLTALRQAGVPILAGTDSSFHPVPGLATGASLHHELALLVRSGFGPEDALRAATSVPADRFLLTDRGRLRPGSRADLVLVDGDPTTTIDDTLNIRTIWRTGTVIDRTGAPG